MNLFILGILLKHFEYFFLTWNFVSNYLKERIKIRWNFEYWFYSLKTIFKLIYLKQKIKILFLQKNEEKNIVRNLPILIVKFEFNRNIICTNLEHWRNQEE